MSKLISFLVPTRNLEHLNAQFDHFEKSTTDLSAIEFLIKIDSDHQAADAFMQEQVKRRPFKIRYISAPRMAGIFSLWAGVEQLLALVDDSSYFIQILSDEPYYTTQGWDQILRRYIGFYPDHVFRLRLSDVKFNNYATHYECAFRCDSFPIYTRRWLELTEGAGDCWGSDAYHQCVAYQLSLGPGGYFNFHRERSLCRDVPATDLKMGGLGFCVGVSEEMQRERHIRNLREWRRLSGYKMQERFSYLARRMYCYIWAIEHKIPAFQLVTDKKKKQILVVSEAGDVVYSVSYQLQMPIIVMQNLMRDMYTAYWFRSSYFLQNFKFISHRLYLFRCKLQRMVGKIKGFILNSSWLPRMYRSYGSTKAEQLMLMTLKVVSGVWSLVGAILSLAYSVAKKILYPFVLLARIVLPKQVRAYIKPKLVGIVETVRHVNARIRGALTGGISGIVKNIEERYREYYASRSEQDIAERLVASEFLGYRSPGLEVVYSSRCRLPPGVKHLTVDERSHSKQVMQGIMLQRLKFRNKVFSDLQMPVEG